MAWLTGEEVAHRLRELRQDATAWLGREFTGQFSLAGAQAKTALLHEHGRWGVPSGSAATSHILKPAVAGLGDHDLNDHLCLDAARRAGLVVAHTRVARSRASVRTRGVRPKEVAHTHEKKLPFAMKVGGDYRVFPSRNTWPQAARDLGLDPGYVVARVEAAAAPEVVALPSWWTHDPWSGDRSGVRGRWPPSAGGILAERSP